MIDFGIHFGSNFGAFWELPSHKTNSWGTPENVLILGSIWGAFPAPKLVPTIDEKSFLGAMLAPDAPKDYFGSIFGSIFERFGSILGRILGPIWGTF